MVTCRFTIVTDAVGDNGWKQEPQTVADFAVVSRSSRTSSGVRPRRSSRSSRALVMWAPAALPSLRR